VSDLDIVDPSGQRSAGTTGQRRSRRRTRGCIPVLLALAVVLGGGTVAVWKGTDVVRGLFAGPEDYRGAGTGSVVVEVIAGDSAGDIAVTLERADVVASVDAFTQAAAADARSLTIQPGFYRLSEHMSAKSALDRLVSDGTRIEQQVTVPEGLTVEETLQRLAAETRVPVARYVAAGRAAGRLGLPGYAGGDLEGYLFPDTYTLPPRVSADQVLGLMVERFGEVAGDVGLVAGARRLRYDPAAVVTMASLVEAEARRPGDFPKVAAVVYNRLDKGKPLELDSTVQFATGAAGEGDVFTTDEQRRVRSPYNTYRVEGLPPGPIDSPGERALRAALQPADADWTYFVTVNLETGRTLFTDSYRKHLRNVDVLRTYCTSSKAC